MCVGRASEASERSERSERNEREAMGWRQMPRARRARQKARGLGLAADAASPTREAKSAWTRAGGRCREPDARGKKRVDSGWRQLPRARRGRQKAGGYGLAAAAASPTREAKSGLTRAGGSCREPDAGGKKREAMGWRQLPRARRARQKARGLGLAADAASPTREDCGRMSRILRLWEALS